MSCRCPIQPDYCVDEPITTLDCAACTTCVLSMNADSLRTVLAHRDRLIERLHATRSTLMAERDVADSLRQRIAELEASAIEYRAAAFPKVAE